MKKYPGLFGLAAVSLVCLLALTACSSGSPTVRYVTVSPQTATININDTQSFAAQAFYSDGSTKDVTTLASWASSNTSVASITPAGVATGVTAGTSTISATYLGASASGTLTVNQPFTSIAVACTPASVAAGLPSNCKATGTPGSVDVTTQVSWTSGTPTVATIPPTASASPNVATTLIPGTTMISATLGALTSNNFSLTVTTHVVNGLAVTPVNPTAAKGTTVPLAALEKFTDGATGPLTGPVNWQSGTATVATVVATATNGSAVASVVASTGSATITATEGSFTGTSTITAAVPVAHYAYVSNINDSTISAYTVAAANGTLTPFTGSPFSAQVPLQALVHPSGKYLYTISTSGASTTSAYTLDILDPATGIPSTPTTTPPAGFSFSPVVGTGAYNKAVFDPTGQFLYVLDLGGTVAGFTINQADGSISTAAINTLPTGDNPVDILVAKNATGTYLYVVNQGLGTAGSQASVSAYSIDATGNLTALNSGNPYNNGVTDVTSLANYGTVDPNNAYLYVTNGTTDNSITVFTIKSDGTLQAITGSPFSVSGATNLVSVAVDPTDKYLYVADSPGSGNGNVYAFNVVTGGGIGTAITGSPFAVGPNPFGIAIDPSGTFLAVVNTDDTTSTISQFKLAPATGALTAPASPATPTVDAGNDALFITFWVGP
ncbi:MAG TPA: beta-propeller fold lactonase family protein [Dongiaceae bacterium]|nr:beta-propeller fold lactonase family protein [Dongiaceae bacterium]